MMDDGSGTNWTICKSFALRSGQSRQHLITQFFTGRMLFLMPNQQYQDTKDMTPDYITINNVCSKLAGV